MTVRCFALRAVIRRLEDFITHCFAVVYFVPCMKQVDGNDLIAVSSACGDWHVKQGKCGKYKRRRPEVLPSHVLVVGSFDPTMFQLLLLLFFLYELLSMVLWAITIKGPFVRTVCNSHHDGLR